MEAAAERADESGCCSLAIQLHVCYPSTSRIVLLPQYYRSLSKPSSDEPLEVASTSKAHVTFISAVDIACRSLHDVTYWMAPQPQKKKAGAKTGKKDKDAAGGATVPAALANLKKRGLFSKDLPNMMYGYGDTKTHYQATVDLVEDIAVEYATALAQSAMDRTATGKAGKLQAEDVLFVVRKDPKKFARGMQLLQMNEEIKTAKKAFEENDQTRLDTDD